MSLVCLKNKRIWEMGAQEWKGVREAGGGQSQCAHRRVSKGVAYCLTPGNSLCLLHEAGLRSDVITAYWVDG